MRVESGSFDNLNVVNIHALGFERRQTKLTFHVGPKSPGISCLEAQSFAVKPLVVAVCPPAEGMFEQPHFCIKRRILGHDDQVIEGIESKPTASMVYLLAE